MPPRKNPAAGADNESWIFVWSDPMIEVFLTLLEEEAHDNGKRSDTGFKPEAWVGFRAGIQDVYQGDEDITTGKIQSKLDYWKQRWQGWKWVGAQSGVGWDGELELWTTSDEVWEIIFTKKPKLRWVRHNTLEYRLLFYKIFENRAVSGDNAQSIQSLGRTMQPTTPIPLTLADCDISSESEGTVTRRENRNKRIAELEVLNQQDNEEHCQSWGASQVKFKNPFTPGMKKSLAINGLDSCSSSRDSSWKRGNEQLESEFDNILGPNKKGKKQFEGEKLAIEMNC